MRDKFIFGLSVLWIIALSVTLTIILSIPLFALEMSWYHLADLAQMSAMRLWHNFLVLMNYLLNPFIGQLHMPDFLSSASGLEHFAEVKMLFMLTLGLTIVLIPAFVIFVKENLSLFFHNGLRIVMGLPIVAGLFALLIGFDQFFVIFHKVLFRDNSWLFDPSTDPIINVLPEQFFMHTFLVFILIYELLFFIIYRRGFNFRKK